MSDMFKVYIGRYAYIKYHMLSVEEQNKIKKKIKDLFNTELEKHPDPKSSS